MCVKAPSGGGFMEDYAIVMLYWERNERAIAETSKKYGEMLRHISENILSSRQDAEECVSDSYMAAWNSMPVNRPSYLGGYMAKIVRNISISRYRREKAKKRSGVEVVLDELAECIPSRSDIEREFEAAELKAVVERFVKGLDQEKQSVFILRYFYAESIEDISQSTNISVPAVKTMLFRLRAKLREHLKEAGYEG